MLTRLGVVPWIHEFTAYMATCQRHPGHVRDRPRDGVQCNSMDDVLAAPHFAEYATALTPTVSEYFHEPARLWSLNAFYTTRDTPYIPGLHGLHKDREASKIVALFVLGYGTPLDSAQLHMRDDGLLEPVYGPAGTAWLADQTRYHCGLIPSRPRMIAWARWMPDVA